MVIAGQYSAPLVSPQVQEYKKKAQTLQNTEARQAKRDIHNDTVYRLLKRQAAEAKPYDSDSSDGDDADLSLSETYLSRRMRSDRCLLVLDVLRRVFITSPGRSASYDQLAEVAVATLLPSKRPGLESQTSIESVCRYATLLLSTRPPEDPYVRSSSVAKMWTWQRDRELLEEELYGLAEELTVILASESKVMDLEDLAEHIPAPKLKYKETSAEQPKLAVVVDEHVAEFRQQEMERYQSQPTLPYEFFDRRVNHPIVVGPALRPGPGGDRKLRDHPMLISERPSHANIKNIVIDGIARLEKQAGTREEVIQKCMESQFVVTTGRPEQYASWVGGALDRMHAERWDPALTYDQDRKLWVYLHGDRTTANWKQKSRELQAVKRQVDNKPPAAVDASLLAARGDQAAIAERNIKSEAIKQEPTMPAAPSFVPGPSQ